MRICQVLLRASIVAIVTLMCNQAIQAADIHGHVYSQITREQLIGAVVTIEPSGGKTLSRVDGGFVFKGLAAGNYRLTVSFIGYHTLDTSINVSDQKTSSIDLYLVPKESTLSDVVVLGYNPGSDLTARNRERFSNNIMNVMSATTIAISPDITVANVMQRISGISIERSSNGDGQHAIIRGMDKRYNTTLVNGVKIPSPDIRNRYVPLDIFPTDLLERIEVIKTLTPDMEGDAAGGVINLVMKSAPEKLKIEGDAAIGYSQLFLNRDFSSFSKSSVNSKSPAELSGPGVFAPVSAFPYQNLVTKSAKPPINKNLSLTLGNRFFNNKLGIVLSGSYQNAYRGSNSNILVQSLTVPAAPDNHTAQQPAVSNVYARQYNSRIDRSGVETKIDYKFDAKNSLSLFVTYLQLNERRVRQTSDSLLGGYRTANNYIGPYAIYDRTETRSDLQSIINATLQGDNIITKNLAANWSLVASEAKRQLPDIAEFSVGRGVNPNTSTGTYTIGPAQTGDESREWLHNTDKDLAGYLNFSYKTRLAARPAVVAFGGMYRHKERANYDNAYTLSPVSDKDSVSQKFISIPASQFTFIPANRALGSAAQNPGIYTASENVGGAYGQIKYNFNDRLEAIGGVRVENTQQSYVSSLNPALPGKTADINYIDYLPSVQARYALSDRRALRASYFRSIFRPSFADLIPFPTWSNNNETYLVEGNPYIKHTVIDNFDVRYELFPKGLDQYMIGAFYKIIANPIEYGFSNNSNYGATPVLSPQNFGTAHNFGVEVVFRKYFGVFGVSGNYTYTHSVINSTKLYVYLTPNGNTNYSYVADKRPLQGQSEHIGNFSLLYKNTRNKIDAQLSLVYTGTRINTLAQYKGFDNWEKATTTLDFSAQKEFGKHYIIYVKANNLLNTPFTLILKQHNNAYKSTTRLPFQDSVDYMTVQYDKFYASYLIGFRFKF